LIILFLFQITLEVYVTKHRKGKPSSYRLRNWSKYNHALKERGKIVFMNWRYLASPWGWWEASWGL